ncbi:hypothetical protein ACRARG_01890 [Pseudooceanicola sp. C21-150M6]|uniref:hypothetical protein n=1 Tax=Pseudooceanicola sp. C21-150M6 TaxID=3434355 RepID=UPI003D7F9440
MSRILRDRADHLLTAFQNDPMPPKMALANSGIRSNVARLWGMTWEEDRPGRSFFLMHPTDPVRSSVWVLPSYGDWIGAYKRFITRTYGISDPIVPIGFDIDHLQAKSTVPGSAVIRLEAVPIRANRSHGAGFEARMAESAITQGRKMRDHTHGSMTWLVALKLAGVLSPLVGNSAVAEARHKAAVAYFVGRGWHRTQVEAGLFALYKVADRR